MQKDKVMLDRFDIVEAYYCYFVDYLENIIMNFEFYGNDKEVPDFPQEEVDEYYWSNEELEEIDQEYKES